MLLLEDGIVWPVRFEAHDGKTVQGLETKECRWLVRPHRVVASGVTIHAPWQRA